MAARYRCKQCGGLTRFEVTVTCTTRYYHHQALDGSMSPENVEVIRESVDEVTCLYCGTGKEIEVIGEVIAGG
jgi:hypothetical protein